MMSNEVLANHLIDDGLEEKTYSAETEVDARGYVTRLYVTYLGDAIIKAHIVGIKVDNLCPLYGSNKNACVYYNRVMKEESGITWIEAATRLEMDIVLNGKASRVKGARYLSKDVEKMFQEIKERKNKGENICIG